MTLALDATNEHFQLLAAKIKTPQHFLTNSAVLSVTLTLGQLIFSPSAKALDFTAGSSTTRPFFFDGTSLDSSWTLNSNGSPVSGWGTADSPACDPDNGLCVSLDSQDAITIYSGSGTNEVTTFASLQGSVGSPKGYLVSFSGSFNDFGTTATAEYSYGNTTVSNLGATILPQSFILKPNETLTFKISSGLAGFGDLTVNNFSYTEVVPGPLPAAGAATAFGFSRRLRRRTRARDAGLRSGRPRRLTHPTAYLNLSTTTVTRLPVSFTYSALPDEDRDVA